MNPTSITERYTSGHTCNATDLMAIRDLESHGFFAMPLLQSGFAVLDAGCGSGTITNGIAEMVFPGTVTALDASTTQLEQARRLSQGREIVNTQFVCASATALPFADETFDLVFSHALLEHLHNPAQAMSEFFRVTRPGGFAAVASPDWDAFEFTPFPETVRAAITAYRDLLESNGSNPRAGDFLGDWIAAAGFMPISLGEWIEEYATAKQIGESLSLQLEAAGHPQHARNLREWAAQPESTFHQSWKYAIGLKAGN